MGRRQPAWGRWPATIQNNRAIQIVDVLSQAVRPIPYYVMALVLLIVFAYCIPIFPFSGAYPPGTHVELSLSFVLTVI